MADPVQAQGAVEPASTVFVLPRREVFGPGAAGAVATIAQRLARATGAVVLGAGIEVPAFPGISFVPLGGSRQTQIGYILRVLRAVALLRPQRIQVHQHVRLALLLARLCPGAKVMLCLHNDPQSTHGMESPRRRAQTLRRLHSVVVVSEYLRRRYMEGLNERLGQPDVLLNPIDLAELPPPAPARRQEFVFAGRLNADKGADLFVAACEKVLPQLPGWSARMIGGNWYGTNGPDSPFRREVQSRAERAGIVCTGFVTQQAVMSALAGAAVAVIPSRWPEPFGLTALEALASGAALITTRQGGLPEVAGEAAFYVPAGDAAALAEAMLSLARAPERRLALGQAGLARARKFDTPIIAAALERLWRRTAAV